MASLPPWYWGTPIAGESNPTQEFQRWLEQLRSLVAATGDVKQSLSSVEADGWLLCDGRSVSKMRFPDLFRIVGNTYGETAETFNLPTINASIAGVAVNTLIKT